MNNFKTDLAYSLEKSLIFEQFYWKKFSDIECMDFVEDLETQKKGYDRIITFRNGKTIKIEEKIRRKDHKDIFLETYANFEANKPGWILTSQADYLAYAIEPLAKIYLIPMVLLRQAFIANRDSWKSKFGERSCPNKTYTTKGIPVPANVISLALNEQMNCTLDLNN